MLTFLVALVNSIMAMSVTFLILMAIELIGLSTTITRPRHEIRRRGGYFALIINIIAVIMLVHSRYGVV